MDYKDRVAFITGGAGVIGEAIGRLFLEKGSKVCLVDIRANAGQSVVNKLKDDFDEANVLFLECDITNDKEFEDAYNTCEKQLGHITILCNNAGVPAKSYRTSMDINFGAVVTGTELALMKMGKHNGGDGGFVVNTASTLGVFEFPFMPMYCATKAAIVHYTRCMGHEFHYDYSGVHINSVCPGAVETPLGTVAAMKKGSLNSYTDEAMDKFTDSSPKLKPREVAEAVIQVIEEHKPGAALIVEARLKPYYLDPPLLMEYS